MTARASDDSEAATAQPAALRLLGPEAPVCADDSCLLPPPPAPDRALRPAPAAPDT